jgi:hypothetical protein
MRYDLGFFDEEADRVECAENRFGEGVPGVTISTVRHVNDTECPGPENLKQQFTRTLQMNYQQLRDTAAANN